MNNTLNIRELVEGQREDRRATLFRLERLFQEVRVLEPQLNAFMTVTEEEGRAMAQSLQDRASLSGPLDLEGVPFSVKDQIITQGVETTCGSEILRGFIPPFQSTVVQRLLDAGAVLVGKTNQDEFGMGSASETSFQGAVRNPWNPERVAGGSSGGSAVSVASGMVSFSIGTDTGGSIRQPASFTGTVGLKPTYGRVSRYGAIAYASSMDQIGPMTRNVEDAARVLQVIAGYDPLDATSSTKPVPDYVSAVSKGVKGLRFGLPKEYINCSMDTGVKGAVEAGIQRIRDAGGEVVSVELPDPHGEWLISTPELSYAIRHVGAAGGLNVSASHNHPDDNGGKFYDEFGGQEVPPNDEHFSNLVELVEVIDSTPFDKALKAGKITYLSHEEIHTGYINLNRNLSRRPQARSAKIVFTNLHGAGDTNVGDVLQSAGFDVHYVPAQRKHDGQFPNVPFQIANPEVPESMEQAVALAKSIQADVVFSTDPDADRIGVMAPGHDGEFVFLTGNEIGALTTDQVFACMAEDGDLPKRPIFVTTEVTSRLPGAIARTHNSQVVDDLLVGCKYIANVISSLENNQEFRHISGSPADYVIGLEESHGLMVSTSVRDKDAAGAAIMLAERASLEKARGKTLVDALYDLYRKVGVHIARQVSIVIEGAVGMEKIASMQRGFRELQMGGTLGGRTITKKDDFLDEAAHGSFLSGTDEKARNFISFEVDGGFRVLVRPSGTEPKIKLYAEVIGNPLGANASDQAIEEERMLLNEQLQTVMDDVAQQGYELLGLNMPRFALRCSPLLGLDARIDFANRFVNELATTSAEKNGDALGAWIDTRLSSYGKDARGLIKWGVQEWLSSTEIPLGDAERLAIQMAFDLSSQ